MGQGNILRSIKIPSLFALLTNVTRVIKSRRMRHATQTGDKRTVYKILG